MKKCVVLGFALLFGAALVAAPPPAAAEPKVGISGYVKLDIQYGDKLTGGAPSPSPASTPLDTDPVSDNDQTVIDARQSRLRVTFSDDVAGVKLSGRVETDFFTTEGNALTSNSRGLRLRHAFARADHPSGFFLMAGQYWSLFMNETMAQPELVDFNGPAGQLFAREPQLRVGYNMRLARGMGDLVFEVDVEKHSVNDDSDPAAGIGETDTQQGEGQTVPLFAGKVSWLHPRFQAEAAVAVAENKAILVTGNDVTETAWGFQVSAQANIIDPLTVFGHFQIIDGLARLANGDFPGAFLLATNQIENVETVGWFAGATFKVRADTTINGVFGWHEADAIPGTFDGTALETHQSFHINVIHKFWQRWQAGLEYRRFDVEAFNGDEGDVNFVHGALWFFF